MLFLRPLRGLQELLSIAKDHLLAHQKVRREFLLDSSSCRVSVCLGPDSGPYLANGLLDTIKVTRCGLDDNFFVYLNADSGVGVLPLYNVDQASRNGSTGADDHTAGGRTRHDSY